MLKVAIVAAMECEVAGQIRTATRVERDHAGRRFTFFERDDAVLVCAGIGLDAARRAAEAVISIYKPRELQSVGFAGALTSSFRVGDIFIPAVVVDGRDGSRVQIEDGEGTLVTFMAVAGVKQKTSLADAYSAQAVDMEAAAVAAAASAHGIAFRAIKVISDEVNFEMPETARFIDSQGRFKTAGFAAFVAVRPWLWPRVATLARNSSKAARTLAEHLKNTSRILNDVAEAKTT